MMIDHHSSVRPSVSSSSSARLRSNYSITFIRPHYTLHITVHVQVSSVTDFVSCSIFECARSTEYLYTRVIESTVRSCPRRWIDRG